MTVNRIPRIPLQCVPILHHLPFSLYLSHGLLGLHFDSEEIERHKVKKVLMRKFIFKFISSLPVEKHFEEVIAKVVGTHVTRC